MEKFTETPKRRTFSKFTGLLITLVVVITLFFMYKSKGYSLHNYAGEHPDSITIGCQIRVPEWEWVRGVGPFDEDLCGIEYGGLLTVVEVLDTGLRIEYTFSGNANGTPCASGTNIIVSKSKFTEIYARNTQVAKDQEFSSQVFEKSIPYSVATDSIHRTLVKRILSKNYHGEEKNAGRWHWVDIVNLEPIAQYNRNHTRFLKHGERCGCGYSNDNDDVSGATIRLRGQEGGIALYEYDVMSQSLGTSCPPGILFLSRVEQK